MNEAVEQVERLYAELSPQLAAYFSHRHGDERLAEDLLQDTFAEALRNLARVQAALSPRAYLFGIARNLSRHAYRKQRVLRLLAPFSAMDETPAPSAASEPDPRLEAMRRAIAALPAAQREVIELRLQQELRYEEIAEVLRIPLGTVRSRLHHALSRLRETLMETNEP